MSFGLSLAIGAGIGLVVGLTAHLRFGLTPGQSTALGVGAGLSAFGFAFGGIAIFTTPVTLTMGGAAALSAAAGALGVFGGLSTLSLLTNIAFDYSMRMTKEEIGDRLATLTPSSTDDNEARRIGRAIANTWNGNTGYEWRDSVPFASLGTQKAKGYYCYEWAIAFKLAVERENPSNYSVTLESAKQNNPNSYGGTNVHYWIKITSTSDPSKFLYVDDGFWHVDGERYVHVERPCNKEGIDDPNTGYFFTNINFYNEKSPDIYLPTIYNSDGGVSQ